MNDSFANSERDKIEFYIKCNTVGIFHDCLKKLFGMGYYWWCDKSQKTDVIYDEYIVCYSGDKILNIPPNIAVSDGQMLMDYKIINGAKCLRKEKLNRICQN